ncbi:MAG TPA: polysaccharide ABC transporter ATP-binding protein [Bryobacteraceae bacterium]|jgi:lipopolysaccharide transport system ATP-binding protein
MNGTAVLAEGLSKQYTAGATPGYRTIRESVSRMAGSVFGRLRGEAKARKAAGSFWALRDVSFEVRPGDVLGILGRNGAGKSTLLKILSRITAPTAGRARLRGRIGSLLEVGTGFHPELSGRDNIQLNGSILGMSRAEINRRFDEITAFAEIEKFLDMPVKHYSSGMYTRLAFAVAAHLDPEILVVDEVLAVGDSAFQKKCLAKMNSVAREGRTILFVSHNMAAVSSLCNRGLLLENGQVTAQGSIAEVIHKYANSSWASPETHWKGDYGDENVRLRETWIRTTDPTGAFDTASELEVGIRILIEKPVDGLVFGFRLLSQFDYELAYVLYDDAEQTRPPIVEAGEMERRFVIPANTLAAGIYKVAISIGIHNCKPIVLFSDYGSLRFELENLRGIGRRFPTGPERGYTSLFRPAWQVKSKAL